MNPHKENTNGTTYDILKNRDYLLDVVKRCQDGDTKAMEIIYVGYKSSIFNLAYRFSDNHFSAEDLLQDIFIKVFKNISKLRSLEAFKSWLYRTAINICISHNRKKGKTRQFFINEEENTSVHKTDLLSIRKDVENAMDRLAPNQKTIFFLHDVQGFTHNEIAEIMKCTVGTSKSQLFKARKKMRNFLGDDSL